MFCEIKGPLNILSTHVCYSLTLQVKIQPDNKTTKIIIIKIIGQFKYRFMVAKTDINKETEAFFVN